MAKLGLITLVVVLLGLLAASLWLAAHTWIATAASPMPASAYVFMGLGVVLSLVVGCGLMALVFYSSRAGYDDNAADFSQRTDGDGE
jgi:heme/copper-type cytochrome/quinol oxidase subunit 2